MSEIKLTEFENPEIYLSTKPEKDVLFAKICIAKQRSSCFRTLPSLINFFKGNTERLQQVKNGFELMDRINLLRFAFLQSVPKMVRSRIGSFDVYLNLTAERSCKNMTVKIGDNIYAVCDSVGLAIVSCNHEQQMRKHFKICKGGVFLDVGAHVGKYSIALSKIVGPHGLVAAIEPHPENFRVLKQNIKLNDLKNVVPYNLAAWNEECTLTFFAGDSSAAFSAEKYNYRRSMIVQAIPLDAIVRKLNCNRVDLVKIDVEGAEYEVLLGLENTLRNFSPNVIVEVWKKNADKVATFFNNLGYNVRTISEGGEYNIGSPNYNWFVDVLATPKLS